MLSTRGAAWVNVGFLHGKQNAYHPVENPDGIVSFTNAENFINTHDHFDKQCCAYGEGYTGTLRLRTAMADHLNDLFHPVHTIDPEEITFAAGVTDLNEVCAPVTCDANQYDSIMLERPIYRPFFKDLTMRTGVQLEYVSVGDTDQFSPACATAYESGFEAAEASGRNVKADEIYALSVYDRNDRPSETFTSIRAIDFSGIIDPRRFSSPSQFSMHLAAEFLADRAFVTQFLQKSHERLLQSRLLAESLLTRAVFEYHQKGCVCKCPFLNRLFIWLDLASQLPLEEANGDGWAAEKLLSERIKLVGVDMDTGEAYYAPYPGRFRLCSVSRRAA
ncbi:MAG: hypothetical protein Q9226_004084 [Calogaya cf. arnoldii]